MCTCYTGTPWRGHPRLPVPNCMQTWSVHAGCTIVSVRHTKEMWKCRSEGVFRTEVKADSSFLSLSAAVENQALRTRQKDVDRSTELPMSWSFWLFWVHSFLKSPSSLPRSWCGIWKCRHPPPPLFTIPLPQTRAGSHTLPATKSSLPWFYIKNSHSAHWLNWKKSVVCP